MKTCFAVFVLASVSFVLDVASTSIKAKTALTRQSHNDVEQFVNINRAEGSEEMGYSPFVPPGRGGASFLATSGQRLRQQQSQQQQQLRQSAQIVMRFSEAVEKNSQALVALEAQQEQLSRREATFEAKVLLASKRSTEQHSGGFSLEVASKGSKCKSYAGGAIKDEESCLEACESVGDAESDKGKFEGKSGKGSCSCKLKSDGDDKEDNWKEICNDNKGAGLSLSFASTLGIFLMLLEI